MSIAGERFKNNAAYNMLRWVRNGFRTPEWVATKRRDQHFYSAFAKPNTLTFDVGANRGDKASIFSTLGSRVICVEPVPECVDQLKIRFADNPDVTVVDAAAGERNGVVQLHVGDNSTISSVLPNWIDLNDRLLAGRQFIRTIDVPMTTLDQLIADYGRPDFCKIDVEGFEPQVLAGLSQPIPCLSFEFNLSNLSAMNACIDRLNQLGRYEFNFTNNAPLKWVHDDWIDNGDVLRKRIESRRNLEANAHWGDVFARCIS